MIFGLSAPILLGHLTNWVYVCLNVCLRVCNFKYVWIPLPTPHPQPASMLTDLSPPWVVATGLLSPTPRCLLSAGEVTALGIYSNVMLSTFYWVINAAWQSFILLTLKKWDVTDIYKRYIAQSVLTELTYKWSPSGSKTRMFQHPWSFSSPLLITITLSFPKLITILKVLVVIPCLSLYFYHVNVHH